MSDFSDKVNRLSGLSPSTTDLDMVVPEAAAEVFGRFGDSVWEGIATREEIPDDGLDLNGRYLAGVVCREGRAFQVGPEQTDQYPHGDEGRPVYWVEEDTVRYQPVTAVAIALVMPLPASVADVESLDSHLQNLIALSASILLVQDEMATTRSGLSLMPDLPSVPEPPAAPNLTYSTDTPPTPPSVDVTFPDAPTKPNIPNVDASVPTFNDPGSASLDYSDFDAYFGEEDTEMGELALGELQSKLSEYQSDLEKALSTFRSKVEAYSAEIQGESTELQAALQEYQTDVEAYVQTVQGLVQEENLDVRVYEAELQGWQTEVQEEAQRIQSELRLYESKLSSFQSELESVQVEIEREIRQVETDIAQRQSKTKMAQYDVKRLRKRLMRAIQTFRKLNRQTTGYRIQFREY